MRESKWYALDNSSKIFPSTTADNRRNTFFICAVLKEKIEQDIMEQAINEVLLRFPSFKVKLKRGIFWYYLEENLKRFKLTEENPNLLQNFNERENNDFLFKASVYEEKLTLTFFHAITDGNGGLEFLKAVIFEYLSLRGFDVKSEGIIKSIDSPALNSEMEDTSTKVTNKGDKALKSGDKKAFKSYGTPFDYDGQGVIIGTLKIDELKRLTKEKGVTITCYLTAVLLDVIYKAFIKGKNIKNKKATVFIPVNLRKWFDSESLRNFLGYVRIMHDYEAEISFEEVLGFAKAQMAEKLDLEQMKQLVAGNVKIEQNFLLRITPLFIKDLAIRLVYSKVGDILHTTNLSNLGEIKLPKSVEKYVEDIFFILDTGDSTKTNASVVSFGDHINIAFARFIVETNLEKLFFRHFTERGLNVKLISNYWEKRLWNIVKDVSYRSIH